MPASFLLSAYFLLCEKTILRPRQCRIYAPPSFLAALGASEEISQLLVQSSVNSNSTRRTGKNFVLFIFPEIRFLANLNRNNIAILNLTSIIFAGQRPSLIDRFGFLYIPGVLFKIMLDHINRPRGQEYYDPGY